ncbi:MAG: 3-oxoacyl-ACP synthase [Bacteroidia bacterium]|nr:3-oxoacyl-ACP synthase [Bacteroidia bacterium]
MSEISFKKSIHQACLDQLQQKKAILNKQISDAQTAASEDTKSSAGDKYETSREMMKQEINKASQQLAIYEKMEEILVKLKPDTPSDKVSLGSLIKTNEGWYHFSVSLGQVKIEKSKVYVLSLASPLGKEMLNKTEGEEINFRGRKILIEKVV